MSTDTLFEVGKAYTFSLYAIPVLGNDYNHAICTAIFSYETALALDPRLNTLHALVYPYLPNNTPDEPHLYNYVRFKLKDGTHSILGIPWINTDTVKVSIAEKIIVEIRGVTSNQLNDIRLALESNGFNQLTFNVVQL